MFLEIAASQRDGIITPFPGNDLFPHSERLHRLILQGQRVCHFMRGRRFAQALQGDSAATRQGSRMFLFADDTSRAGADLLQYPWLDGTLAEQALA